MSERIVAELTPIGGRERASLLADRGDRDRHAKAFGSIDALTEVEVGGAVTPGASTESAITVAAWNITRGTHLDGIAAILDDVPPDLMLLTELDVGMARSGNRHTVRDLAQRFGHRYVFGVEFVELGLGTGAEVGDLEPDATNESGFHGNALLARGELIEPSLIRIEADGAWFTEDGDEPRVGGRCAVAARVSIGSASIVCCSVHLESESDPALRAEQMQVVLEALDDRYGPGPAIIGGDLNTVSAEMAEVLAPGGHATLTEQDPSRWRWPIPYEPLFDLAADHGFDFAGGNRAEATVRLFAEQDNDLMPRLDWLLVRDLTIEAPRTIPAVADNGRVLTDHDLITATIRVTPP